MTDIKQLAIAALAITMLVATLFLTACAHVITEAGADENGRPFMRQEVSGTAGAVVKAAQQSLDGKITIDPDTGILAVEIISGQNAESVAADAEALLAVIRLLSP